MGSKLADATLAAMAAEERLVETLARAVKVKGPKKHSVRFQSWNKRRKAQQRG